MIDILPQIIISPRTVDRWVRTGLLAAFQRQVEPSSLGEEVARPLPDGSLLLSISFANGEIFAELVVPASEWEWRG